MIRFDDQVAVVTGSGRGLGEAYACLLAARGARVVVHDAGVTLGGQGFDPAIADSVVRKISEAGGRAVSCYENIETREGCYRLWDLDPSTTDADRVANHVPSLQEQLKQAERYRQEDPQSGIDKDKVPEWMKEALERWEREDS